MLWQRAREKEVPVRAVRVVDDTQMFMAIPKGLNIKHEVDKVIMDYSTRCYPPELVVEPEELASAYDVVECKVEILFLIMFQKQ